MQTRPNSYYASGVVTGVGGTNALRTRNTARVQWAPEPLRPINRIIKQRLRVQQFQRRWESIKEELPPQLSRRHIGMISIGGVIGTGLFLGSADALYHGGPLGALLGYSIIGSVVYCLCVSVGEMIAFLPNVGGVVGLADLYVDPALGFSLGWAAWYNWSVTLPAEITAAAVVAQFWESKAKVEPSILIATFLTVVTFINCFPSHVYGEVEFWLSAIKIMTIIALIFICIIIDLGAGGDGPIGFRNWKNPGPFAKDFLGTPGALGRFLGFWAVLMQASFAFFGSEVPGIAAGEVIDASRNVPRALRRVWIRITLFYVGSIFCAGLVVPYDKLGKVLQEDLPDTGYRSPFVLAVNEVGWKVLPDLINAAILLSAWSAAASDIYISSRFLFFLAKCKHAPQLFGSLIRYPSRQAPQDDVSDEEDILDRDDDDLPSVIDIRAQDSAPLETMVQSGAPSNDKSEKFLDLEAPQIFIEPAMSSTGSSINDFQSPPSPASPREALPRIPELTMNSKQKPSWFVLPLRAVLASASVGLLSFLSVKAGSAEAVFGWLVSVASIASLQSWIGMLFTYIRWHQGTKYAEKKHLPQKEDSEESVEILKQIERIKVHRHWGQPYLAYYAFIICIIVLLTNGWAVFIHHNWKIAKIPGEKEPEWKSTEKQDDPVALFLASYIPIPFFLLLTLGYKIVKQTKMVKLEEMTFSRELAPETEDDEKNMSRTDRILARLLIL